MQRRNDAVPPLPPLAPRNQQPRVPPTSEELLAMPDGEVSRFRSSENEIMRKRWHANGTFLGRWRLTYRLRNLMASDEFKNLGFADEKATAALKGDDDKGKDKR